MKKKILFVIPDFYIGGTNKSLENLITLLDCEIYDFHIFSLYNEGDNYFKQLFGKYCVRKSLLYSIVHDNFWNRKIIRVFAKCLGIDINSIIYKYEINYIQRKYNFHAVIAYQEATSTYVVSLLNEKIHKIAWIHCDYLYRLSFIGSSNDVIQREAFLYNKFHSIVCVSNSARESFVKIHPQLADRTTFIYNSLNVDKIYNLAKKEKVCDFDITQFNILSVGRFSPGKQFHLIPKIASELLQKGIMNFRWYIIASTNQDEKRTVMEIKKYGVMDKVILLGAKSNPYPYFLQSNLQVCLSQSESFSYVIAESKVLHIPVLCNDFPVAREVISASDGWVYPIEKMPSLLAQIITNDNSIYSDVVSELKDYKYNNGVIVDKIEELLNIKS